MSRLIDHPAPPAPDEPKGLSCLVLSALLLGLMIPWWIGVFWMLGVL